MTIDRARFATEYRRATTEVMRFVTPENQKLVARHNPGWDPAVFSFDHYLAASEQRYLRVIDNFNRHMPGGGAAPRILDVGGFLGAFPLALARVGAQVTLVEEYGYYDSAFDALAAHLSHEGVTVWGADFSQPLAAAPEAGFDLVTAMAILEHLPDSPRPFMTNLRECVAPGGIVAIDVPNIAYWPNRVRALKGESVHPPLQAVFDSAVPFTGHHREYTAAELSDLLTWTGFDCLALEPFNYTVAGRDAAPAQRLRSLLTGWPALAFDSCRELILAVARPAGAAGPAQTREAAT